MRSLLALGLCLCLCLAGCGGETGEKDLTTDEARLYVEGMLRELYLGEFDQDYLDLVGIHEHDAQEAYRNSLGVEAQYFFHLYGIEYPSDALYEEVQELYGQIYGQARFQILSADREEDGSFSVEVRVEPIDLIQKAAADLEEALKPWYGKYPNDFQSTMTTEEWEEADQEWSRIIVDTVKARLPQLGYLEPQTVKLALTRDEEGYYSVSKEDFSKLNDLIIDYTLPQEEPEVSPTPEASPAPTDMAPPEATGTPDPDAVQPPTTASPLPLPSPEGTEQPSPTPTE